MSGGQRPAVLVAVKPTAIAACGLDREDASTALVSANVYKAKSGLGGPRPAYFSGASHELFWSSQYRPVVIANRNGAWVWLCDAADVTDDAENVQQAAGMNNTQAVILNLQRPPRANVTEFVDRIKTLLPQFGRSLPLSASKMAFALPDKPSIAVLPFVNMSDDPQQEYLSDGITEDMITDLSKISGLLVIARDSVFTYKGKSVKVNQVSRDLGVRYVVEGSVRKQGDKVRITAQLVDATTGGHVWAERYDRDLKDVFDLQDEITQRIVAALEVKVMEVEQERVMRKATTNLNAYDYALRG